MNDTDQSAVRPTKKQRALLDYIQAFIDQHGYSPSYREIMNGCGYNSIATVAVHVNNLIARGHLHKRDHSARSLELTGSAVAAQSSKPQAEATWVLSKLEALLAVAEAGGEAAVDAIDDLQRLLPALPVLGVELSHELEQRLGDLEAR